MSQCHSSHLSFQFWFQLEVVLAMRREQREQPSTMSLSCLPTTFLKFHGMIISLAFEGNAIKAWQWYFWRVKQPFSPRNKKRNKPQKHNPQANEQNKEVKAKWGVCCGRRQASLLCRFGPNTTKNTVNRVGLWPTHGIHLAAAFRNTRIPLFSGGRWCSVLCVYTWKREKRPLPAANFTSSFLCASLYTLHKHPSLFTNQFLLARSVEKSCSLKVTHTCRERQQLNRNAQTKQNT